MQGRPNCQLTPLRFPSSLSRTLRKSLVKALHQTDVLFMAFTPKLALLTSGHLSSNSLRPVYSRAKCQSFISSQFRPAKTKSTTPIMSALSTRRRRELEPYRQLATPLTTLSQLFAVLNTRSPFGSREVLPSSAHYRNDK